MFSDLADEIDEVVIDDLVDGRGVYTRDTYVIEQVPYLIDRDYQIYDENQLAQTLTTLVFPASIISRSRSGDAFTSADGKQWQIHQTLEDDGHWRRVYIS